MFINQATKTIAAAIKQGASIPKPPTTAPAPKTSDAKPKAGFDQWIASGGPNRPELRTDNAFGAETLPVRPQLGLPKTPPKRPQPPKGWPLPQLPSLLDPKPMVAPKDRLYQAPLRWR